MLHDRVRVESASALKRSEMIFFTRICVAADKFIDSDPPKFTMDEITLTKWITKQRVKARKKLHSPKNVDNANRVVVGRGTL